MRLQQLLFAAFTSIVLLIGCSKPVDAKTFTKPQIINVNLNPNVRLLEIVNQFISILHNDSDLYVNQKQNSDFRFFSFLVTDSKKKVQLFHKEEEIKINGEFKILNRYL